MNHGGRVWEGKLSVRVAEQTHQSACGDKISLPHAALTELDGFISADGEPVMLELRARKIGGPVVYGTVLDFAADENVAVLPAWMIEELKMGGNGAAVFIKTVEQFQKAEFCTLIPQDPKFFHFKDFRAVLEAALGTRYTTLAMGTTINIDHQGKRFAIDVKEVQPDPVCSILNTDVEVDLQPPLGEDGKPLIIPEESNAGAKVKASNPGGITPTMTLGGKAITITVDTSSFSTATFMVPAGAECRVLAETAGGADFEIYAGVVGPAGDSVPNRLEHDTTCYTDEYVGAAEVLVPVDVQHPRRFTLSVRAYGDRTSPCDVSVRVEAVAPTEMETTAADEVAASAPGGAGDFEVCGNCHEKVPAGRLRLHQAYCERHNVNCPICTKTIRRADQANHWHCDLCPPPHTFTANTAAARKKHLELFHTPTSCKCDAVFEMRAMVAHRSSTCPERSIICRFCQNIVRAGAPSADAADAVRGYTQHESVCGSKTVPCDNCGSNIRLRDMEMHGKICGGRKTGSAFGANPSRTASGRAVTTGTHQVIDASAVRGLTDADRDRFWARSGFGASGGGSGRGMELDPYDPQPWANLPPTSQQQPSAWQPTPADSAATGAGAAPAGSSGEEAGQTGAAGAGLGLHNAPVGFFDAHKPTKITPPPLCTNDGCSLPLGDTGNRLLKVCSECWAAVGCKESGAQALLIALIKKYFGQITAGCGNGQCRNTGQCKTSDPVGLPVGNTAAAAAAVKLAQDSLVGDGTARAHICLGDRQRAFTEQVRQAGEMGFPPAWCALALTEDRSMEAAVAWLLSNYAA